MITANTDRSEYTLLRGRTLSEAVIPSNAQACLCPALTERKPPASGGACPSPLSPQQATMPVVSRSPQVWEIAALTETKRPSGDTSWPELPFPQQTTLPVSRTPQAW